MLWRLPAEEEKEGGRDACHYLIPIDVPNVGDNLSVITNISRSIDLNG
jgi:hypothetical protein